MSKMMMISFFYTVLLFLFVLVSVINVEALTTPTPPQKPTSRRSFALITGATGRTGKIVSKLLLEKGFGIRVLARDADKARESFMDDIIIADNENNDDNNDNSNNRIEFCSCELGDSNDVQAAFAGTQNKITHVIFCAGGDNADYNAVNYRGVTECARQAVQYNVEHMVIISTAWATKPYSIASLLFNTLYDSIPMACHYMGEQELRKAAISTTTTKSSNNNNNELNYVILRAGGLNSDERYKEKYPEAAKQGLTYQQGDCFEFLGPAGRPGMCRTQLAHAVVAATNIKGRYTVEVTGSGTVDLDDSSIYDSSTLIQDSEALTGASCLDDEEIMRINKQAITELKNTTICAGLIGICLVSFFGWFQGIVSLLTVDALFIFIWSRYYANRQI